MALLGSGLRFHFKAQGLDETSFNVLDFTFVERLSRPFEVKLTLLSRLDNLTPEAIVDQAGLMSWSQGDSVERHVHGVVSQFSKADTGHQHTQYHITLVPALSRLKLRKNSRIFQQQNVLAIISTLLNEMGISDHAFTCDPRFESEVREYCVQYSETDFEFVSRLAAEVGLFYYFEHSEDKHTLIFCDSTTKLSPLAKPFPYNALSGGAAELPFVRQFSYQHQIKPAIVTLKDQSFKKPEYSFLQSSTGKQLAFQRQDYEHFDYPGRYKDDTTGKPITQVRQEYLRRHTQLATGHSNIMQAISGAKFALVEHSDKAFNRDWVLTKVTHNGEQGAAAEEANTAKPTRYTNEFEAIPANNAWQAKPKVKPLVTGPQKATVVGPKGEEIFCDEFGRVKVQFPWDREGQHDDQASCWVQVSQGWAGAQYGMMAIPRIGHQVIVSFLEGDPDQPIITGRTFHATNTTPYILPNHKTRTVLKTQSHKGEGFNELRFEDEASREQIFVHGQKDLDIIVGNNRRENTGFDHHLSVENDQFSLVKQTKHSTVGKDRIEEIRGDKHQAVGKNLFQKVTASLKRIIGGGMVTQVDGSHSMSIGASEEKTIGGDHKMVVNKDSYLKASNIVLEAGTALTIKGPGGFITIDSGGVTISGSKVKINEGGSAGQGSAPQSVTPEEPSKPTLPDPADKR
ncbi:type VI secretion system tip protein VgrG [Shewanella sp. VB17]|uniref:type VI secretion system Vgr family protein n=1 Tax=Shewanella sp. VB17 TaxID=2739432 RepID=UPI0015663D20|nr:type VI secretion system tip protein TssI/VgrG [Shewanella sp. VB17]NRD72164.1 type VI secretion system tip protein VgrG [Shewanella sp. VB17]